MLPRNHNKNCRRHSSSQRLQLIMLLVVTLASGSIRAQDKENTDADALEQTRQTVTHALNYLTRKIDAFFSDSREYEDATGSWAKVNLQMRVQENKMAEYVSTVQIKIALPRTENRFNIVVQNDTENELGDGDVSNDPLTAVTDPVYSGGLRYVIKRNEKWYAHISAGIQFSTPIDFFIRGRLRRNFKWGDWRFLVAETATLYQSGRSTTLTHIDLEHLIAKKLLYRNRLIVKIEQAPEVSDWSFDTSLFHRLDSKQAIQYQTIVLGDYDTLRATDFSVNLRYRRQLQRKWIFLEITPQVLFSEINNFTNTSSIYFKLEFLFRKINSG